MMPRLTFPLALGWLAHLAPGQAAPPWLTGESRPADLVISLVTVGPGASVPEYFGHAALEVRDQRRELAAHYNFGMFEFTSDFLWDFARGRMHFWLAALPARSSYEWYVGQDRDVFVDELDLPPAKAAQLARDLAVQALPENRRYLYHHYDDNCATRIADAIDKATDGALRRAAQTPARLTLREHTRRCAAHDPLMDWLLVFAMNRQIDRPITRAEELFLPDQLRNLVRELQIPTDGAPRPLVRRSQTLHEHRREHLFPDVPPRRWPQTLVAGSLFAALLLWSARRARRCHGLLVAAYGTVAGTLGLLLAAFATLSEHAVTHWNENLLVANPLSFALLPAGYALLRNRAGAARRIAVAWRLVALPGLAALLLKALPMSGQDNVLVLTLLVPIQAAGLWSSRLMKA
jgi:hypothetical protein